MEEIADKQGLDVASTFWDVGKFFDSISIVRLVKLAVPMGFPVLVAAVDLQLQVATRVIKRAG
eukprot:1371684-Lingulodinium_polyedra.AAC.1